MREHWRGLVLLVRTAFRTDPWRCLGLLLEPLGQLRIPLTAWFLKLMVDGALAQDLHLLSLGAVGIAAAGGLWFLGIWTGSWIRIRLQEQVGFAFDREITTLTSELPGLEHQERPEYQDRLELLRQQQGVLGNSLNDLISAANMVVLGIGMVVALVLVSPWMLLLVLFALPALPIATLQQRWLKDAEQRFAPTARLAHRMRQLATGREAGMELRVFGLEQEILSRFRKAWLASRGVLLNVHRRAAYLNVAGDLVFLVGFAAAVAFMVWRATRGEASVGEVVMAVYLGQAVQGTVAGPIRSLAALGIILRSASRLLWLQEYARESAARQTGVRSPSERLREGIDFENVWFKYPGAEGWVLQDVSFRIPAGAVIALVGENGAGKTTLVKLLTRMYEPTRGRILVDGVPLGEIEIGAWRRRLSAAFQDFARLEFTARAAVGVGDLARVDDGAAVAAALERAGAAGVLETLPDGEHTLLGAQWEGGVDLSTGQWQQLALGRALMRENPLVVFFDEPTASLDAPTEHALFERFMAAARTGSERGAVTVLVSHRFSTVRGADLILVIEGGTIAETGTHRELIRYAGLYAELYCLQARAYG
jgi:ATP-binding cassette, subfamily B, bacterial